MRSTRPVYRTRQPSLVMEDKMKLVAGVPPIFIDFDTFSEQNTGGIFVYLKSCDMMPHTLNGVMSFVDHYILKKNFNYIF